MAYFKLGSATLLIACLVVSQPAYSQLLQVESYEPIPEQVFDKLNVNLASVEQLVKIKGLGPKKAKAIVEYIQQNGALVSLDELLEIRGIGKGLLSKLKGQLSL